MIPRILYSASGTTSISTLHIHIAAITAIDTHDLLPSGLAPVWPRTPVAQSVVRRTIPAEVEDLFSLPRVISYFLSGANAQLACVAGGFGRARSKVLAAKPREEWDGSEFAARCGANKTFDPVRTKPPAMQANAQWEIHGITYNAELSLRSIICVVSSSSCLAQHSFVPFTKSIYRQETLMAVQYSKIPLHNLWK